MSIKTFADLNAAIETCVDEYVECYELDDGECHHEPTEHERFLIADAISGLIADEEFMALMRMTVTMARDSVPAFALPPAAEVQRLQSLVDRLDESNVRLRGAMHAAIEDHDEHRPLTAAIEAMRTTLLERPDDAEVQRLRDAARATLAAVGDVPWVLGRNLDEVTKALNALRRALEGK